MYGLHGKISAHAGQRDALLGHFLDNLAPMPGCHLYIVSVDPNDTDAIWVYEVWDSAEHHQASLQLESVQKMIAAARPLIAGMSDRVEFTPQGGLGLNN